MKASWIAENLPIVLIVLTLTVLYIKNIQFSNLSYLLMSCLIFMHTIGGHYTFERVRGVANLLFGGSGFFIDKFHARHHEGILWLHGYGNVFEKVLAANEQIDVEPAGWLYKDTHVRMETVVQRLSTGIFAGAMLFLNRFTGPGKVAIQSMYAHLGESK